MKNVKLPDELHRKLKVLATVTGRPLCELIADHLEEAVKRSEADDPRLTLALEVGARQTRKRKAGASRQRPLPA